MKLRWAPFRSTQNMKLRDQNRYEERKKVFCDRYHDILLHKNFTRQYILMIMHYIHLPSTVFIFILLLPFSFFGWSATNKLYLSWNMESFYIKRINIVSLNSLFTRRSIYYYSYFFIAIETFEAKIVFTYDLLFWIHIFLVA